MCSDKLQNMDFQHVTFHFREYEFNREKGILFLRYSLDDEIHFEEKLIFNVSLIDWNTVNLDLLDRTFFHLHLIGGVSYYKTYLPKKIEIHSGKLSEKQAEFWNTLYTKGLGEFFYRNDIDFLGLIHFPISISEPIAPISLSLPEKTLLPMGGGKDSIVSAELLLSRNEDFRLFSLEDHGPIAETSKIIGKPRILVKRELSPKLFEMNKNGAYNGHVPITAYISFLLLTTSVLYGYKNSVLSLERSANYGNLTFHELEINHQYSKSKEFEENFMEYVRNFLSPDLRIYSLLRPYYEIKIAKMFAEIVQKKPEYLKVFTSCNRNFSIQKKESSKLWCGECPKCAFTFLILAPFLPKKIMIETFGKNLFADEKLLPTFRELLGISDHKPFECVGIPEESKLAFVLIQEKGEYDNDIAMKMFQKEVQISENEKKKLKQEILSIHELSPNS
ncbi:endonuclease domain-containing protein [Candidatus Peregrinibacteria bacterium]|nr:endonuclease domain-containing protein [Candidatus Peregrinibacteria bacterium]